MKKEQLKERLGKEFEEKFPLIMGMWIAYTKNEGNLGTAYAPNSETRDEIKSLLLSTINATWNSAIDEALEVVGEDLKLGTVFSPTEQSKEVFQRLVDEGINKEKSRLRTALTELKK